MTIRLILLGLLGCLCLKAQMQPATFSVEDSKLLQPVIGRNKKIVMLEVIACSGPLPSTQAGGDLYSQAGKQGFITIAPQTLAALLQYSSSSNLNTVLAWSLPILGGSVTAAATSGLINIAERNKSKWNTAGVIGTGALAAIATRIGGRAPNPSAVLGSVTDPNRTYQIGASTCYSGLIGAQRMTK